VAAVGTVDVKRHLRGLARTGDGLVVDQTHVEFIDSTVIGALLGAYKEAGGETAIRSVMEVPLQEVDGGKERSRRRA
jgi:anti-anti-sigma regulatory factor